MALNIKNRKKVETLVIETLKHLEPGGLNAKKYQELFKSMSDKEFLEFFTKIQNDPDAHLYVENDLYGKNQITMDSIRSTSKFLGVPLEEYVTFRHGDKEYTTAYPVPVMYVHLKRMQQLLSKKTITNVDIAKGNVRSRITGGLNSTNKSGRFTDSDTQALISVISETAATQTNLKGEEKTIHPLMLELLQFRGDNAKLRSKMQKHISFYGSVKLEDILDELKEEDTSLSNVKGQATHSLNIYYLGAGMDTDIIEKTYLTKISTKK